MGTADEYLQYAQESTRWAVEAKTEEDRQAFLDMAKAWTVAALAQRNAKLLRQSEDWNAARPQPHS
jgi:hypothetical protein